MVMKIYQNEYGVRNIYTVKTTILEILKKANGVKHVFWKYIQPIPEPTIIRAGGSQVRNRETFSAYPKSDIS